MDFNRVLSAILALTFLLTVKNTVESALPFGVFPFLTSGWYYKPSPEESVIFGLIVVKILAIRLASVTGILPIPYHLNDLFVRSLGKRSIPEYFLTTTTSATANLTKPHLPYQMENPSFGNISYIDHKLVNETVVSPEELKAMYRLLLGVRRMDTSDCFLKTLCFLGYENSISKNSSFGDYELIETINYMTSLEEVTRKGQNLDKPSIMDVFYKALTVGMKSKSSSSCDGEYLACSLSEKDMSFESILSDIS